MDRTECMEQLRKLAELQGIELEARDALLTTWSVLQHITDDTFDDCNYTKTCDACGRVMLEGYCIDDGDEYYCSDNCLHKYYTTEEYLEMYDDGNGHSYWTDWT